MDSLKTDFLRCMIISFLKQKYYCIWKSSEVCCFSTSR